MNVAVCVIGFFAAIVMTCCVFKYSTHEVTVGSLILSIIIGSIAFLGAPAEPFAAVVLIAFTPAAAAGIAMLVCILTDNDKRLF